MTNGHLAKRKELVGILREGIPNITSIIQNIQNEKTNVILGEKNVTLWGKDYIIDSIGDLKFKISPMSFYQVNPKQTEALYSKALEFAALTGTEKVIDVYSGIGTISLFLAQKVEKVYGVEVIPQAIEDGYLRYDVILIVTTIFLIRVLSLTTPTSGDAIGEYSDPKSALFVIDLQNDTTCPVS